MSYSMLCLQNVRNPNSVKGCLTGALRSACEAGDMSTALLILSRVVKNYRVIEDYAYELIDRSFAGRSKKMWEIKVDGVAICGIDFTRFSQGLFENSRWSRVSVKNCNLEGVWLSNATLTCVKFERVRLLNTHLKYSYMEDLKFVFCDVRGCNVRKAEYFDVEFCACRGPWMDS